MISTCPNNKIIVYKQQYGVIAHTAFLFIIRSRFFHDIGHTSGHIRWKEQLWQCAIRGGREIER